MTLLETTAQQSAAIADFCLPRLDIPASLNGLRVVVWGFGRHGGGLATARYAAEEGARVTILDRCGPAQAGDQTAFALAAGWPWQVGGARHPCLRRADLILVSPAVPPQVLAQLPPGLPLLGADQLFFARHRGRRIVVTGTKGKSTTAHICSRLLQWPLGGNSFTPLLELLRQYGPDQPLVTECSSFQLWYAQPYQPRLDVLVITTLGQDHLDWHPTLDHYHDSKINAAHWANAVVAAEECLARLPSNAHPGMTMTSEAFCSDDGTALIPREQCRLLGEHNARNAALALRVSQLQGLDPTIAGILLMTIVGLPHRLEIIAHQDGTCWFNDSIATTPEATVAALEAIPSPTLLILSGRDKGGNYRLLADAILRHGQCRVLCWLSMPAGCSDALSRSGVPWRQVDDLATACSLAPAMLPEGGAVLLSPGAATLPPWLDYVDRGEHWRQEVLAYNPAP